MPPDDVKVLSEETIASVEYACSEADNAGARYPQVPVATVRALLQAAREVGEMRKLLRQCVLAMEAWGREEDGIPEAGPIAVAYDAAKRKVEANA